MPNNALYFPYINVPSTSWTTQAILYWDKLATIVPMDHLDRPEQMDVLTRELLSEGLVEPIVPGMYLYEAQRFDECFIEFVEKRVQFNRSRSIDPTTTSQVTRIHAEKMGQIPDYLVEKGLAKRLDHAWYEIETPLANQFMAYLATVLGAIPEVNATPITDKAQFAVALRSRRPVTKRDETLNSFKAREVILKSLLPIPDGPVDVNKLIMFKNRHGHLLQALRTKIEAHCALVTLMPEPAARAVLTEAFINDCNDNVAEIVAAMQPTFAKVTLGSLTPLFGAGASIQAADSAITFAGAAMSLVGAAFSAISSIHGLRMAQEVKPLAYIAHVRRELVPSGTRQQSAPLNSCVMPHD